MREIKFRGREKESNKWVFGYARHWKCCYGDEWHIQGENDNVHIVIPETVGQFTGLKDHKGREIYEGDIVKVINDGEESFHVVKYMVDEDYPAFDLDPVLNDGECNSLSYSLNALDTKIIVIGNIYDNPELLRLTKK
jgi:uncharacterized phage protein (TIGR01671 family)